MPLHGIKASHLLAAGKEFFDNIKYVRIYKYFKSKPGDSVLDYLR